MAARRFKSKVDRWIFVMIGVAGLMVWLIVGTYYTVDRDMIRIASGPFRWKVPIGKITSVTATRSLLSSPALSLDRICIRYGKRRRIMISPADKAGFLKAIGHELSA
jgi:hypothetical protein